jgi:hypothetical protein
VIARSILVFAAAALALPAQALTPQEAASYARTVGRPLTSYIRRDSIPELQGVEQRRPVTFATGTALPIYLNRHGGNYQCGDDDSSRNLSSVVCGSNAGRVTGFRGSDAQWAFVRDCVADQFAQFNVYVTDQEPTSGDYVEAVVGGSPDQAGMPFGVGGVAPFSCGVIPNAVVYAFADVYGNDFQGICETAAQEIAHAFGLDHEFLCEDPMTYLSGCGDKSFQDTYAQCGEFEPRECSCGGSSQNSVQMMLERLGASDGSTPPPQPVDTEAPSVSVVSPAEGDILPANSTITVVAQADDDVGLTTVQLEWDFTGDSMYCPATLDQTGSYECTRSGDRYTWNIQVGTGSRSFRVHVVDVAGNDATSEDRTIWLSEDGSGPPADGGAPTVFVATPADGTVLPANSSVEVVATIADDAGISRAELMWTNGQGELTPFPCPFDSQNVSCAVNGTTYTWSLQVGEGERTFTVKATDVVGNVTESDLRTIQLDPGAAAVTDDGDDTLDRARSVKCGETITGDASDADWIVVDAPEGKVVTVTLDGEALGNASLIATKGPLSSDEVANGTGGLEFDGDGSAVKIAVVPEKATAGDYTLEVYCEDAAAKAQTAGGCAQSGSPAGVLAFLAVLGLVRRRRRNG